MGAPQQVRIGASLPSHAPVEEGEDLQVRRRFNCLPANHTHVPTPRMAMALLPQTIRPRPEAHLQAPGLHAGEPAPASPGREPTGRRPGWHERPHRTIGNGAVKSAGIDAAIDFVQHGQVDTAPQEGQPARDLFEAARRHHTCHRLAADRQRQLRRVTGRAINRSKYD